MRLRIKPPFGDMAVGVVLILTLAPLALAAPGPSGLRITQRIAGPDGGWDLVSFDPARRRLYVAHGARVTTLDVDSGKLTPAFAPGDHLHAVTPAPGTDRLVTTNSGDNTARLLNADTGALIASIPTAPDPDSAAFDPANGEVLVMGGHSGTVTLIDPKAAKAAGTIAVGGSLEFPVVDPAGRLLVNNEDLNEIDVVDVAARKVTARYPLAGCRGPTGLAYVAGNRLVSACANGVAKILDARTGHEIVSLTIGERPDAVIYDADRAVALIPCGATGTLSVIALAGDRNNQVIDEVPTQVGARTGAVDPKTGRIYLPTAEYLPPAAPGQRPQPKPGTFQILVLDR